MFTYRSHNPINDLIYGYGGVNDKSYFDFDGKTLLVGNGKIGTVTTIIEYFKTQNVTYSQSFIQKRRVVATLKLQTASGVIKLPCLHEEDARTIQERIVSEVEGSTKDWI